MADASFSIAIDAIVNGIDAAAKQVLDLDAGLNATQNAADVAAEALKKAEKGYAKLESQAGTVANSLDKVTEQLSLNAAALARAQAAGDEAKVKKLTEANAALTDQQSQLSAKLEAVNGAVSTAADKVDQLAAAHRNAQAAIASAASEAQAAAQAKSDAEKAAADSFAADWDAAIAENMSRIKAAEAVEKAAAQAKSDAEKAAAAEYVDAWDEAIAINKKFDASQPTGKVNEMSEAFGKLGGPVGHAGQKLTGFIDGFKKLTKALGPEGAAIAAAAVVIGAIAIAAVAAAYGIYKVLETTVQWADKNKRLEASSKKLDENLKKTFGGLKIDKLLDGLDTLVALFDDSTASGKALKFMFETMFQPFVDGASGAIPTVERLFIQTEILALKAYLALRPFESVFKVFAIAVGIVSAVLISGFALGIAMATAPLAILAAGITAVVAACVALGYSIAALVGWLVDAAPAAWNAFTGALQSAFAWIAGFPIVQMGTDLIMGLVHGITGSAGAVVSAITGAVGGAIDAAKSLLGIHSPSRVFAEIGENTAAGFSGGVEDSTGDIQGALEAMVSPPATSPGAAGGKASGGGGLNLQGATFVFNGVANAEEAESRLAGMFTRLLEGDLTQLGAEAAA